MRTIGGERHTEANSCFSQNFAKKRPEPVSESGCCDSDVGNKKKLFLDVKYWNTQIPKKETVTPPKTFVTIKIYTLTHCGQVKHVCVFSTVKLGTSASSP